MHVAMLDQAGAERLRARLRGLGFDVVRFARAEPVFGLGLRAWLDAGHHADMTWLERGAEKRGDPDQVLPGARTMILLGVNYGAGNAGRAAGDQPLASGEKADGLAVLGSPVPVWARYAQYSDYHDTIKAGLAAAGLALEAEGGIGPGDHRYYVDTGPVLERGWAARAGVGFTGKNAMLISREFGNWLFLACIVTRLELPADDPLPGREPEGTHAGKLCGKCTRCLDACPTRAFVAPGAVDARRCISYQTIENKGVIPRELRAGVGDRIYGCDICAEVCPWNRFARASRSVLLTPRPEIARLTLLEILELTPERFSEVFRKTAIKRVKLSGLLRNACVVAGNTRALACVGRLRQLADPDGPVGPMVRAHAVWALAQLGERAFLAELCTRENDSAVLAEYGAPA
jgi:epoxyqueuosine reductase